MSTHNVLVYTAQVTILAAHVTAYLGFIAEALLLASIAVSIAHLIVTQHKS